MGLLLEIVDKKKAAGVADRTDCASAAFVVF